MTTHRGLKYVKVAGLVIFDRDCDYGTASTNQDSRMTVVFEPDTFTIETTLPTYFTWYCP